MPNGSDKTLPRRRLPWVLLTLTTLVTVAMAAIPVFVIMPFRAQTAAGVAWSYVLRQWAPLLTLAALLLSLGLSAWLWRGAKWPGRLAMFVLLAPLALVTWFARQNHFEWMFNPLPDARYAHVAEAAFAADADMVMAVEHNGDAVAFPVRAMAYHHIVNDVVGGKPVTATY